MLMPVGGAVGCVSDIELIFREGVATGRGGPRRVVASALYATIALPQIAHLTAVSPSCGRQHARHHVKCLALCPVVGKV